MNIKEVTSAMQTIEFVLFTLKNGDSLHAGELENAYNKANEVLENYCVPNGGIEE
jgi:hypothetical protein